jgi:hypothetical protein
MVKIIYRVLPQYYLTICLLVILGILLIYNFMSILGLSNQPFCNNNLHLHPLLGFLNLLFHHFPFLLFLMGYHLPNVHMVTHPFSQSMFQVID